MIGKEKGRNRDATSNPRQGINCKEGTVGIGEQLLKEYAEWLVKRSKADERIRALLPRVADLPNGERFRDWIPSQESLVEYESAKQELHIALSKIGEIRERLYRSLGDG